ncbi:MAG: glycyl-radical enzyme activating protein [Oscillospiraceae bacterium]|nr:glycyl-radical enzyme activating protein [Oscillospiraceae bacterium]
MIGEVFDILRFAVHDGPGIRCTAFFKGCPLNCIWCHNPEGKKSGHEVCCLPTLCIGCASCIKVCQNSAISFSHDDSVVLDKNKVCNPHIKINRQKCVNCANCAKVCPSGAIMTKGRLMTANELVEEFSKEDVFFHASNGGITISGGEPLFQPEFMAEVLKKANEKGYHTTVETCLFASADVFNNLIILPNLWIVDLKIFDENEHKKMTGVSNLSILCNYERLATVMQSNEGQFTSAMITRIPVIPNYTDSEENLIALGEYISRVNPGCKVELMFYNPLGESKYKNLDLDYPLFGVGQYTAAQQSNFQDLVASTGVEVVR